MSLRDELSKILNEFCGVLNDVQRNYIADKILALPEVASALNHTCDTCNHNKGGLTAYCLDWCRNYNRWESKP
jgi:hypothetical protein